MPSPYPTNPNWPAGWGGFRVSGTVLNADGTPVANKVLTFTMDTPQVTYQLLMADGSKRHVVGSTPLEVTTDLSGHFTVVLPSSDNPNIVPRGWTYSVEETWDGGRPVFHILGLEGYSYDIDDLAPVQEFQGTSNVIVALTNGAYDGGFM